MEKIIQRINQLLKEAKFETFAFDFPSHINKYCYDLIVKSNDIVFIIKIFPDIDSINEDIIKGIKILSKLLKSKPLLIGIKNRYKKLEDNTIYIRSDLPLITLNTLEKILKNKLYPFILARRGGGVIYIDGKLLKTLREQKNITRKELSEEIGITKRTLCSYESENMRPSKEIATKISKILESKTIFREINIFNWDIKIDFKIEEIKKKEELNQIEEHIQNLIEDIGIKSYWYKNGLFPFDMLISSQDWDNNSKNTFYPLISDVAKIEDEFYKNSLMYLLMFTKLFQKDALFIVDNDFKIPNYSSTIKIPFIKIHNLEKIEDEEEFIDFIKKSKLYPHKEY
ncbi:MAG: helix-turn-helix domain-containing protein [Candidatus Lokiarchaeota archaeon]|nr:helix-turn-helix domain-containing protein [Candidatus Lokiarchaeota archaeon]